MTAENASEVPVTAGHAAKPFLSRHRKGLIVICVIVSLLGILGYAGARFASMARNLQALQGVVQEAKAHAAAGDTTALAADLVSAHQKASAASSASRDITVRAAGRLPWVGEDVRALRVVSQVAGELTGSVSSLSALVPNLTGQKIAGGGTGFDLTLLATLRDSLGTLDAVATSSGKKLEGVSSRDIDESLRAKIVTVTDALAQVSPAVHKLEPLLDALPIILGASGPRTWFVTMQNLTEARPSGGLLSAYVILHTDAGRIDVLEQGSNDTLVAGPPVPYARSIAAGYQEVWGDAFGSWLSMNLSANFPDTATLIRDGWNKRGGVQVDSVLALGQGTLPYLAAAVGPVTAGTKTIAPQDLTDYLTVGIYQDYADPVEKDAVVSQIIDEIFTKLSGGQFDLKSLVTTAVSLESADYLQLWSADSGVQQAIEDGGFSGELTDALGPVASVRVVNAGGNKLDAFMSLTARYELGACTVDEDANTATRTSRLTVTITNDAPTSGLPPYMTGRLDVEGGDKPAIGSNHDYVVVYAPAQAALTSFALDGDEAFVQQNEADGREFSVYDVELAPGQTRTLTTVWDEPGRDDQDRPLPNTPSVIMQPLLKTPEVSTLDGAECA